MFRNDRIRLKPLVNVCRSLSTMLDAGVDVRKAFSLAAKKTSDSKAQDGLKSIRRAVKNGNQVSEAMRNLGDRFPPLMVDLVEVGEKTGSMPEVFSSLSRHYESSLRMKKEFQSKMAWPIVNFFAAVGIVSFLIFILGLLGDTDILGWGLMGPGGAAKFLLVIFGTLTVLFVVYKVIRSGAQGQRVMDPILLGIPIIGTCLRSFAIARFSWVFALTQQAGMSIEPSLESSLKATDNGAFISQQPQIWESIRGGDEFTTAIAQTGLFPSDYIAMVESAEHSGTVPEALVRLSPQFEDEARRKLNLLANTVAWTTWVFVAGLIIFVIFSIVFSYLGMLDDALNF